MIFFTMSIISIGLGILAIILGFITLSKKQSMLFIIVGGTLLLWPLAFLLDWKSSIPRVQAATQPEKSSYLTSSEVPPAETLPDGIYYVIQHYHIGNDKWGTIVHRADRSKQQDGSFTVRRHPNEYPSMISMWPPPIDSPFIEVITSGTNKHVLSHQFSQKHDYKRYLE